jgi:hypothetical protein
MSMDDAKNPYRQSFDEPIAPQRGRANVLGIVGFVLAFCLPPLGLLLSIIAAFKAPRGFAIAGIIIGLIGTALIATAVALGFVAMSQPVVKIQNEVVADYMLIDAAVKSHQNSSGSIPGSLSEVAALTADQRTDPWGNQYQIVVPTGSSRWQIRVMGPDGLPETSDDLVLDANLNPIDLAFKFAPVQSAWNEAAKAAAPVTTP